MSIARAEGAAVLVSVKAVPGARQDQVVGRLGDRLKIRVSAPAEGGRANQAIRELLARALGVPERSVSIVGGLSSPEKTVRIEGLGVDAIERRWPA